MAKTYTIKKLSTSFWRAAPAMPFLQNSYSQNLISEYRKVGNLKFSVFSQLRQINLVLERRTSEINQYREFSDKLSHDIFEKSLSPNEKKKIGQKSTKNYELIVIDTESYFEYVKLFLDKLSKVICHYENSLPKKASGNFAKLFYHVKDTGCQNKDLNDYIKNHMRWYILMISVPRNNIFIHNLDTDAAAGGDHRIDFGITKSSDKSKNPIYLKKITKIKNSYLHELPELANQNNLFQILRILDHNSDKLSWNEIDDIKDIHKKVGGMYPYVKEVNKHIQEFMTFLENWIRKEATRIQLPF